jgi:hypothetical protein
MWVVQVRIWETLKTGTGSRRGRRLNSNVQLEQFPSIEFHVRSLGK